MVEELLIIGANVPVFLAVAGLYYQNGGIKNRLTAIERRIPAPPKLKQGRR